MRDLSQQTSTGLSALPSAAFLRHRAAGYAAAAAIEESRYTAGGSGYPEVAGQGGTAGVGADALPPVRAVREVAVCEVLGIPVEVRGRLEPPRAKLTELADRGWLRKLADRRFTITF